jgi:transcriptional regulator with XRE-family HTH domain
MTQEQRFALADFLKRCRSRLSPQQVGLPLGRRRRVSGLRREEVAELAEISATYYAWIEQARPVNLSAKTLECLAEALRLNLSERQHLRNLTQESRVEGCAQISEATRATLEQLEPFPVLVVCRRWTIVACNQAAELVFGPLRGENLLYLAFTRVDFQKLFVEWERFARCTLNHFRHAYHYGLGSSEGVQLVEQLQRESPIFRQWWPDYEVSLPPNWRKHLRHPHLGELQLDPCEFTLDNDLRMIVYTPADAPTRYRLQAAIHSLR